MDLFGLSITRKGKQSTPAPPSDTLTPVAGGGGGSTGGYPGIIREPYTGAWQKNETVTVPTMLNNPTVFACISLLASDVAKVGALLTQSAGNNIWQPVTNSAWSPVLRQPNRYQNSQQFRESWLISKLCRGNTYVLKERDAATRVRALYVLDPCFVWPLVAPDGSIWYRLSPHRLAASGFGVTPITWEQDQNGSYVVPASEIVHDRFNCLFHQLVGLSPLFAAAMPAMAGLTIGNNANKFWGNAARPSGVLTAPAAISKETASRLADYWQDNFTGTNSGRVAVLGDGLKFESMTMTALDAQLVEQLKWSDERICSVFHVPAFKVGVGAMPTNQNAEVLNSVYYSDGLQALIEAWENCMDAALEVPITYGVQLDVNQLLRMDASTRFKTYSDAIGGGWMAPNEARRREDMAPVAGGDTPYLQQQNYSLAALARRDNATPAPATTAAGGAPP